MRSKRKKSPIPTTMGDLQDRAHFKNKASKGLFGWYRPAYSPMRPLKVDYTHR